MKLPAPPRTIDEVNFYVDESPCYVCGQRGLTDEEPRYREGLYRAMCATCKSDRSFEFDPLYSKESAPPFFLAPDAEPTALFDAAQLRAIADREMSRVPAEPTEIATRAAYNAARAYLVRGRIALNELVKFQPGDAATTAEAARAADLYAAYKQAQAVVDSKPGALPPARGLGERFGQHAYWLQRGKVGDGRLVFRNEFWEHSGMSTSRMHEALIEDTTFQGIDLSFSELDRATIRGAKFLGCDLNVAQLDGAVIENSDFRGSALGLGRLRDTRISGGDWSDIAAGRSRWTAEVTGVDLRGARFRDAVLDDSVFVRCDLRGADFSRKDRILESLGTAHRTRFVECDLRGAKVEGWRLDGTVFERCLVHGLEGTPDFEGKVEVDAADLSPDGDRSVIGVSWPR
jgi:uncharacterized protein YjbI with pentapeptide repeats